MDRIHLRAGLVALLAGFLIVPATASARRVAHQAKTGTPSCRVSSLPSFVAQGEFLNAATVADVIEVSCNPNIYSAGAKVTVIAAQLLGRCHQLTWYRTEWPGGLKVESGPRVTVSLDGDGNANLALIAGPKCMPGENLITADQNSSPFETFTTSFQVLPSVTTPPGLYMTPAAQVEDTETSSVVTIAQAEFAHASEKTVRIGLKQLRDRCERFPHVFVVRANRTVISPFISGEVLKAIELDNNGNGFVLIFGYASCAEGESLIEAGLEASPFTTPVATFTVEGPRVR